MNKLTLMSLGLLLLVAACGESKNAGTDASVSETDAGGEPDAGVEPDAGQESSDASTRILEESGEILKTETDNDLETPLRGCATYRTNGVDRDYPVTLVAGKQYLFMVVPDFGTGERLYEYNPALYVISDRGAAGTSCVVGSDLGLGGVPEAFTYTPTQSGIYYVVVDSRFDAGVDYGFGKYTLTVDELTDARPSNDTCAGAELLDFVNGRAVKKGHTWNALDDVNLSPVACTLNPTAAPDLFYKVELTAGNTYDFMLQSNYLFNESLYVFTGCGDPAGACVAGVDEEESGFEMLKFVPETSGTYFVAVDGRASSGPGTFYLEIGEGLLPPNNTCANAQELTLVQGKATTTADTTYATNTWSMDSAGCLKESSGGPDLFYRVTLEAGKSYLVTAVPDPENVWDPALYVFAGCADPQASCIAAEDASGTGKTDKLIVTPTVTGAYYLAVDSYLTDFGSRGALTLSIEEFVPLANDKCAGAQALAFTENLAVVDGDTGPYANEYEAAINCGVSGGSTLVAPQLYYSFDVPSGKTLQVTFTPQFHSYIYLFPDDANCAAAAINSACGSCITSEYQPTCSSQTIAGMYRKSTMKGHTATFTFAPTSPGTYLIGIDGPSANEKGAFHLELLLQ